MDKRPAVLRRSNLILASVLIGSGTWVACASMDSARRGDDPVHPAEVRGTKQGTVVNAPQNVISFSPENTAIRVDAETVDLRQIFEDIGPIATLWYQHVQTLANPFFEGRVPESRGMELAKEYMEFYYKQYGLEPAFPVVTETPGGAVETSANWISYRQPFSYSSGGDRLRPRVSDVQVSLNGEDLKDRTDFAVLGVSGSGRLTAPVSFVGYGITDGQGGYTSFDDGTDLTGRIAMVFRYEPLNESGTSQWATQRFSTHANIANKLRNLRERNAAGIILVNPPGAVDGASGLESITRSSQFGPPLTIPVVQMTPDAAEKILAKAAPEAGNLLAWRRKADNGEVTTVHLPNSAQVTLACTVTRGGARAGIETANVGGVLRGKGRYANEWVVIGAHLDHVGMGQFGTSPQYRGQLHPGADDNASGSAGVLILAKTLSEAYAKADKDANLRSILFIGFSAEESGLHGSRFYANNPTVPLDSISCLINMDMIGRVRDRSVSALGVGTAAEFERILTPHFESSGLTVAVSQSGSGRSDDASFHRVNVPALHFFSGMHAEYHAPSDKAYTVNPAGARDVLLMIHDIAMDIAAQPRTLTWSVPGQSRTEDRGYAPVRLGIRPGMGDEGAAGVLVDEVSIGTSAADAGIQRGDVIIAWDGEPLDGMRGLFESLQKHKPGDVVKLTVIRNSEEIVIDVTLKSGE